MHDCVSRRSWRVSVWSVCFDMTRGGPYLRGVIGSTVGVYPRGTGSNPVEGNGHFFPHAVSSIFRLSLTRFVRLSGGPCRCLMSRSRRSWSVSCMIVFHEGAGGWVSEVFVSTDARRACPRGVIGSTVGAYPRGTGSNPVEGNGHFFPSCRQLYLSSFSDTRTHARTHTRTHTHTHTHTLTHTHTHTLNIVYIHTLRYPYNRNFHFPSPNSSADQELNILFLETSAKSGQNVTEAFHNVIRLVI